MEGTCPKEMVLWRTLLTPLGKCVGEDLAHPPGGVCGGAILVLGL